jgi:transitional endoplasmic reticulum ATPase
MMVYDVQFVKPPTSFYDIAGLEEVKNTLRHIASSARLSIKKTELDLKSSSPSILLYGPPGTGKSLLAAAMANECEAQFTSTDCYQLLFGCTAWSNMSNTDKVKFLFSKAEKNTPSIIFFEGVDSLSSHSPELKSAFNHLLKELDNPRHGVIIIASATKPEEIPWSLFRRFSYKLKVTLPDEVARREMIIPWLEKFFAHGEKTNSIEVEDRTTVFEKLVIGTEGFSGEEILDVYLRIVSNSIQWVVLHKNEKIILKPCNFELALEEVKQERKRK